MKKLYQAPEVEVVFTEKFCQTVIEGPSDNNGEVTPMGNENKLFDENEPVTETPTSLWDD